MPAPDPLITDLRTLRHMLGIRATDIAQQAGITTTAISQLENGHSNPGLHTLRAYAAAIGYDLHLVSAATGDAHLTPLLDLTADEVQALINAADHHADEWASDAEASSLPADQPDPHLIAALDKLRPATDQPTPKEPTDAH